MISEESPTARHARQATIGLQCLLLLCIILWRLLTRPTAQGAVWAIVLCIPLLLPLRGLLRGERYTYAWATLCVIPYFIVGTTESIADPRGRGWAAACLTISLALFAALIVFIRTAKKPASAAST
jgi:uncharacterized membrane protein